jgi:hypothetical protein
VPSARLTPFHTSTTSSGGVEAYSVPSSVTRVAARVMELDGARVIVELRPGITRLPMMTATSRASKDKVVPADDDDCAEAEAEADALEMTRLVGAARDGDAEPEALTVAVPLSDVLMLDDAVDDVDSVADTLMVEVGVVLLVRLGDAMIDDDAEPATVAVAVALSDVLVDDVTVDVTVMLDDAVDDVDSVADTLMLVVGVVLLVWLGDATVDGDAEPETLLEALPDVLADNVTDAVTEVVPVEVMLDDAVDDVDSVADTLMLVVGVVLLVRFGGAKDGDTVPVILIVGVTLGVTEKLLLGVGDLVIEVVGVVLYVADIELVLDGDPL